MYFAAGRGLCLVPNRLFTAYRARIFDRSFRPRGEVSLEGIPSRARVSPDGRYGATTVFVAGDSYADGEFSTRTNIIDMQRATSLGNLEEFEVPPDGNRIRSPDFNFWGVTFARQSDRCYATLATKGRTYLVEGSIATRRMRVLHENVECPSLSPDNTRVAFKKLINRNRGSWRLHVLDLRTMTETPLAETRSVDDQAEWLENGRILYGLDRDVWVVRADGSGSPRKLLSRALSPAVVCEG